MAEARQPIGKRPPHKPRTLLQAGQLAQLVNAYTSERPTDVRDRAVLALLTTTGLRALELCSLSLDQMHEGYLAVPTGKVGRRGTRKLPLTKETESHLHAYLTSHRRPCREEERALLLTHDGHPLDSRTLAQIVREAAERAQLPERHVTVALLRASIGALRFGTREEGNKMRVRTCHDDA